MRVRPLLLALVILLLPTQLAAQGEHSRRAAAELLLIAGDAKLLTNGIEPTAQHKKGLIDRIAGSLAGLDLLLRLADQEVGVTKGTRLRIAELRRMHRDHLWGDIEAAASALASKYPITIPGNSAGVARAKSIHSEFCAACHDEPDLDVERPAYNLFKQSRGQSTTEFYARLVIGVRGDKVTGYANPLTDFELRALLDYYRNNRP